MAQKIFEVREQLASKVAELKALVGKEADLPLDESLSDDDTTRITALEGEIEVLKGRVSRLEALEAMPDDVQVVDNSDDKAMSLVPTVNKQFQPVASADRTLYAQPAAPREKGLQAARFVIGAALATKYGPRAAADQISKTFGDDIVAKAVVTVAATGTNVIPQAFSTDIVELLRPAVAVRNAGATVIDTTMGQLTIPALTGSASASWLAENTDIPHSNETFGAITLSNHKLAAMVPVSMDIIRRSPLGLDNLIRDDIIQVMARAQDSAFLTGTGASNSPTGLKNMSGIQTFNAAGSDLASATAAINGAVAKLQLANTRMLRPTWIMNPMSKLFLSNLRDGVGNFFIFHEELDGGTLAGYPVVTTTSLPINLTNYNPAGTGGTKGSDIFLVDMSDILIGDTMGVQLETSTEASYWDGSALQSAFSRDLLLVRCLSETDIASRHPTSIVDVHVDSWVLY